MISVREAEKIILRHVTRPKVERIALAQALGRVTSKALFTDRPFPPYNRITMDGIAIASSAFVNGQRYFEKEATQFAGEAQKSLSDSKKCIETATGAILPIGCDTIIPYEHVTESDGGFTFKPNSTFTPQQNVHHQGSDFAAQTEVVSKGTPLNSTHLVIAASIGATTVEVYKKVSIAVISTGDELVAIEDTPLPHQIRRSNHLAIESSLPSSLCSVSSFHLEDDEQKMNAWLDSVAPQFDVLIFSGGVSMGKKDYLPNCLKKRGFEEHFHRIKQRPGKPMWFGSNSNQVVFGMPGNPVSTHFCTLRYALPFLNACYGLTTNLRKLPLNESISFPKPLTLFKPVQLHEKSGSVTPIHTNGSGDFISLGQATGFIELPANQNKFEAGTYFNYHPFT